MNLRFVYYSCKKSGQINLLFVYCFRLNDISHIFICSFLLVVLLVSSLKQATLEKSLQEKNIPRFVLMCYDRFLILRKDDYE